MAEHAVTQTTQGPLAGLRVIEIAVFVAAPLGGMTLAQLGAEVIRIDPIGGNIDFKRWPVTQDGNSLYWAGLNKAKKSVTLALDKPEGRALAEALITAPGADAGILLTNLPDSGWMSYAALSKKRSDLIMLRLTGNYDGTGAVDYTVNASSGFPLTTGRGGGPVNHVLPAWDVSAGLYLATGLLAAERVRRQTGKGQEVKLALSDVMLATVANLGYVGDVQINNHVRPPVGNDLWGAFGRDFPTADGRRVMIVAFSNSQWRAVVEATGLATELAAIGPRLKVDMNTEDGRYAATDEISNVLAPWFAARTLTDVRTAFAGTRVLWGPYQDFAQLVAEDPRCSPANPMFATINQPGIGSLLAPGIPLGFSLTEAPPPLPAPRLGANTADVLGNILGLSASDVSGLRDRGIIARAAS